MINGLIKELRREKAANLSSRRNPINDIHNQLNGLAGLIKATMATTADQQTITPAIRTLIGIYKDLIRQLKDLLTADQEKIFMKNLTMVIEKSVLHKDYKSILVKIDVKEVTRMNWDYLLKATNLPEASVRISRVNSSLGNKELQPSQLQANSQAPNQQFYPPAPRRNP